MRGGGGIVLHDCKSTRLHGFKDFKTQQRLEKSQLDSKAGTTTRTKIDLKLFRMITQNIDSPESFNLPFFTRNVSTVIFSEGGYTLPIAK